MTIEAPQTPAASTEAAPDAALAQVTPAPSEVPAQPASTDAPQVAATDVAALQAKIESLTAANASLQSERDKAQARVQQLEAGVIALDGDWSGFLEDCANQNMNAAQIRDAVVRQRKDKAQTREQQTSTQTQRDAIIGRVALEENGRDFALFLKDLTTGDGALSITDKNLPLLRAQFDRFAAQGKPPVPPSIETAVKKPPVVPAASGAQGVTPASSAVGASLEAMAKMTSRQLMKLHFAGKK